MGKQSISNAAREPEIVDLQNFLNRMGAHVQGAGTSNITIEGVEQLSPVKYQVIPDRIVAGTFLLAAGMTGSRFTLENTVPDHIAPLIHVLQQSGVEIDCSHDIINIDSRAPI